MGNKLSLNTTPVKTDDLGFFEAGLGNLIMPSDFPGILW